MSNVLILRKEIGTAYSFAEIRTCAPNGTIWISALFKRRAGILDTISRGAAPEQERLSPVAIRDWLEEDRLSYRVPRTFDSGNLRDIPLYPRLELLKAANAIAEIPPDILRTDFGINSYFKNKDEWPFKPWAS